MRCRDEGESIKPLLTVEHLHKTFPMRTGLLRRLKGQVHAVNNVTLSINSGETLGLVGESGCGKSTLGRCIIRLEEPSSGTITFDGNNLSSLGQRQLRPLRQNIQMIFQDPYSSLNPKMTVFQLLAEPILLHNPRIEVQALNKRLNEIMEDVGLPVKYGHRYPHEFSGGQRQRISIGRATASMPKLIICDEPVSALDVSIQAQIINLLMDLQKKYGLSYLFISHDLSVVRHMAHRISVMYLGRIVEHGRNDDVFHHPKHPYTQALLSAVPIAKYGQKRQKFVLKGDLPSALNPPSGCFFHPRCHNTTPACTKTQPALTHDGDEHAVACIHTSQSPITPERKG